MTRSLFCALFLLTSRINFAPRLRPQISVPVTGLVEDENRQPVPGVQVSLRSETQTERTSTNELGRFRFEAIAPGGYRLDFDKAGFFRLSDYAIDVASNPAEITVTLNHEYEIRGQVDVVALPSEVDPQQTRHEDVLVAHEIREDPVPSSHTLQNALPALPGVLQDSNGLLHVAGARGDETLYVLDGFQMNDPANGSFDARVNVDAVRRVDLTTARYGPEFANAAAGVLALQTDTGDDRWRFGTTNFFPALSLQRGTHLGNWFPRVTFSGPIAKGRAWFSDALSVQHNFALVRKLPPGADTSQSWSGDNLLRAQYNFTPSHSLQGNFLSNVSTVTREGLGPFVPAPTTTDARTRRYFLSGKDQIVLRDGLLEFGIASDTSHLNRLPQGSDTYVITPTGPQGSFFERVSQSSHRWQGHSELTLAGRHWHGPHTVHLGAGFDETHLDQVADRHAVEVRAADSTLVRQTSFTGNANLSASELQTGGFAEDSWQLGSLVLQSSVRMDRNDFIRKTLLEPRWVLNWFPRMDTDKLSFGWGIYYQPVYLASIALAHDQERLDVLLNPAIRILSSFSIAPGLRQPYFEILSAEWQHQWDRRTTSTVHVMNRRQRRGLAFENVSGDPFRQQLELQNNRQDRYRSLEVSLRRSIRTGADVAFNYTYSRARSNRIFDYSLEDFLLTSQAAGPLSWDAPHRVISRGTLQTSLWNLFFSYFAEYHTGFPFTTVNSLYQRAGPANGLRFPSYFDVNIGAEKRFGFYRYQWAVRLSVINVTGHHNYNSVINNIDAANFLTFAGGQHRAFTARLRLVGRK